MKKTIFALAAAAAMAACSGNSPQLHVEGNLQNAGDTLLLLAANNRAWADTVIVTDGKFKFATDVDSVQEFYLVSPALFRGEEGPQIRIIAVPGEKLTLTGDANDHFEYNGSQFYQDYNEVSHMVDDAQKELREFTEHLMQRLELGAPEDSVMQAYQTGIAPLEEKATAAIFDFVKEHADMEAAATLLSEVPAERIVELANLLSPSVRNGRMKSLFQNTLEQAEAQQQAEAEAAKKQAEGIVAPDFTLNDLQGKPLQLSSLRGKYVILDFWGSWCSWCIKGIPQMKEYYKKYAGKFEILGIDCNDSDEDWHAAVAKHQLPWLHVYNPRESSVLTDYGIQGFPTKIILSPEGKIVRTIVGEDPAFYELLDELFGK